MEEVKKTTQGMYRKQEIIEKAIELFAAKGVAGTSMRVLAEAVGIRAASLYNHFKSKDDIIDHIVLEGVNQLNRLKAYNDKLNDQPADVRFKKMLVYWLCMGDENEDIVVLFIREPHLLNQKRARQFIEPTNELIAFFKTLLRQGIEQEVFCIENSEIVAFNIWGLQLSWIARTGLLSPDYDINEYANEQADLILKQIVAV